MNLLCFHFHTCFPWRKMHQSDLATGGQCFWAVWKERTDLLISPTEVQWLFVGPQHPMSQGNTIRSISVAPWDLWHSSPPPKPILSSSCHWYELVPCELLHADSKVQSFLPSCSQKHICQDRLRVESKLLGRFAPMPQCLTVLTYLSLNLQPQPRIAAVLSVLPSWDMAMRQPETESESHGIIES